MLSLQAIRDFGRVTTLAISLATRNAKEKKCAMSLVVCPADDDPEHAIRVGTSNGIPILSPSETNWRFRDARDLACLLAEAR